jgi:hypothetical protein
MLAPCRGAFFPARQNASHGSTAAVRTRARSGSAKAFVQRSSALAGSGRRMSVDRSTAAPIRIFALKVHGHSDLVRVRHDLSDGLRLSESQKSSGAYLCDSVCKFSIGDCLHTICAPSDPESERRFDPKRTPLHSNLRETGQITQAGRPPRSAISASYSESVLGPYVSNVGSALSR